MPTSAGQALLLSIPDEELLLPGNHGAILKTEKHDGNFKIV